MSRPDTHVCYPLWVGGTIRATCAEHWWERLVDVDLRPAEAKAAAR